MAEKMSKGHNEEIAHEVYAIYCLALAKHNQDKFINIKAWTTVFCVLLDCIEEKIESNKRIPECIKRLAIKLRTEHGS